MIYLERKKIKIQKLPWWAFKARRWRFETILRHIYEDEIIVRMQLDGYDIRYGRRGDMLYFIPRESLKRQNENARGIFWKHPRLKEKNTRRWFDRELGVQTRWWKPPGDLKDINEIERRPEAIKIFEILRYHRAQLGWLTRYSGWLPTALLTLLGEADS